MSEKKKRQCRTFDDAMKTKIVLESLKEAEGGLTLQVQQVLQLI